MKLRFAYRLDKAVYKRAKVEIYTQVYLLEILKKKLTGGSVDY